MEDKTITCIDCKQPFVFTVGEQKFFVEKGFTDPPKRCKPCRDAKKQRNAGRDDQQAQPAPQPQYDDGNRRGGRRGGGRRDDNEDYARTWNTRGRR